jgi:hypothetical protein
MFCNRRVIKVTFYEGYCVCRIGLLRATGFVVASSHSVLSISFLMPSLAWEVTLKDGTKFCRNIGYHLATYAT